MPERLGLLGGTGPEGRGLAARFALAGHDVVIGSRDAGRAADAAARVTGRLDGHDGCGAVTGAANREAAELGDVVFLAVPYSGQAGVLS
ncbi:MAG: NAD(P)-binding domain-containing protein, partial [Dehalococcoidia bacterium]